MRIPAMALHPSPRIEWLNDSLPELATLRTRRETFDLVMLTAVWMHLDEAGHAECRLSGTARTRDHHEDPPWAGPTGTTHVRGDARGDD